MRYASLCAIIKDEGPDIREWLSYHLAIGFEHVFLYDNNSLVPVRVELGDYISAGLVTVTEWPLTQAQQLSAYWHALNTFGGTTKWLAFIDADEFVFPRRHDDIRDFLDAYADFGGVGVHWAMFGSNGHVSRPAGLVLKNYTLSLGLDPHIKSIVQPRRVQRPISAHHFAYRAGAWCVNEDKVPVRDFMSYPLAEQIRINHYYYKSQQDYQAKIGRGLGTQMKSGGDRRMQTFYDHLDVPALPDTDILRHAGRLQELMELSPAAIAALFREGGANDAALIREVELALARGDVEGATVKGRLLARHHEGVALPPRPCCRAGRGTEKGTPQNGHRRKNALARDLRRRTAPVLPGPRRLLPRERTPERGAGDTRMARLKGGRVMPGGRGPQKKPQAP